MFGTVYHRIPSVDYSTLATFRGSIDVTYLASFLKCDTECLII